MGATALVLVDGGPVALVIPPSPWQGPPAATSDHLCNEGGQSVLGGAIGREEQILA